MVYTLVLHIIISIYYYIITIFNYTATISDYAVLTDAKQEFQRYEQALARYAEEGEGHNSDPSKRRYLFLFERTLRTRGRDHMQVQLLLIHHIYDPTLNTL